MVRETKNEVRSRGGVRSIQGPIYTPVVQLNQISNSIPSWLEVIMLAFQHTVVMLGTTVMICKYLVTKMGGDNGDKAHAIQNMLFISGINTLLQTLLGTRLPTIMVASSTFMIPVMLIVQDLSDNIFESDHERFIYTIKAIQGALIVASIFKIVIGYSYICGKFTRYFSPVIIVPVICLGGLGKFKRGFPQVGDCLETGLPMLFILVISQQYLNRIFRSKILDKFGVLISLGIVWALAALLTVSGAYNNASEETKMNCRTDSSNLISSAQWVRMPYPFQWGAPIFKANHIFLMMAAALIAASESTATHFATARSSGVTPPPCTVLSRSVGVQGIGLLLAGFFGAVVGTTSSVENAGLIGLTRVGSRKVVQISSVFMIFFSIFGLPLNKLRKFGAFFSSIPFSIYAAMYCVLFGHISATGISFTQFTDSNTPRNLYVSGLSLFLGLSIPEYFNLSRHGQIKTAGGIVSGILKIIFSSSPTMVMAAGTLLDNTLDAKGMGDERGLPWWTPFQTNGFEYYGLPNPFHYRGNSGENDNSNDNANDSDSNDDNNDANGKRNRNDKSNINDHKTKHEDNNGDSGKDNGNANDNVKVKNGHNRNCDGNGNCDNNCISDHRQGRTTIVYGESSNYWPYTATEL